MKVTKSHFFTLLWCLFPAVALAACISTTLTPTAESEPPEVWLSAQQVTAAKLTIAAELERARQKSRLLRNATSDTVSQAFVLLSPLDGEVTARNVNPGVEVQGQYTGGTSVELFTVGELDYPDQPITGQVDWVAGSLDATTHTAKIRCTLPNPDHRLKPEMYATVLIDVGGPTALAVPRSALLRLGDHLVVFVREGHSKDGKQRFLRRTVVTQDEEPGDLIAVTAGLKSGEEVVTQGAVLLLGME